MTLPRHACTCTCRGLRLTVEVDRHEVKGYAGRLQESAVHDRDLRVALAEVRQDGPVCARLLPRLHRLMSHGMPLQQRLLLKFVLAGALFDAALKCCLHGVVRFSVRTKFHCGGCHQGTTTVYQSIAACPAFHIPSTVQQHSPAMLLQEAQVCWPSRQADWDAASPHV